MKELEHIIYGYYETGDRWKAKGLKHPRWYVGVCKSSNWEDRHKGHRNPAANSNAYWPKWVHARKKEGKTLDQLATLVPLQRATCTPRQAEQIELDWTEELEAKAPTGFVTKAGGYKGRVAECVKRKMSKNRKGIAPWNKGVPCAEETRRKASITRKKTFAAKYRKLREQKAKKKAERLAFKAANPSIRQIVEQIVIKAGRQMFEFEVRQELAKQGIHVKKALVFLMRAAGYRAETGEKTGRFEHAKLERIQCESSLHGNFKYAFQAKQLNT